jgi:hypothetical protein
MEGIWADLLPAVSGSDQADESSGPHMEVPETNLRGLDRAGAALQRHPAKMGEHYGRFYQSAMRNMVWH